MVVVRLNLRSRIISTTNCKTQKAILDVRFDRRNFYNKMKRLGMLDQLEETINPSQKKEAFLFRFNKAKYELKQKGFRLEY